VNHITILEGAAQPPTALVLNYAQYGICERLNNNVGEDALETALYLV
jgi:hypothetical protein